jgi:hypothetical protein
MYPHNTGSSVMNKTAAIRYRHHVPAIRKSGFLPTNWWAIQKHEGLMKYPGSQASRNSGGTPSIRSDNPYANGMVMSAG